MGNGAPLTPSDVLPVATALSAYSICTSLPDGLKVVSEKLYAESPIRAVCARQAAARQRQGHTFAGNSDAKAAWCIGLAGRAALGSEGLRNRAAS